MQEEHDMRRNVTLGVLLVLALGLTMTATMEAALKPGVYAKFVTTEGNFTIQLFEQEAPKTVANFIGLAEGTKEWTDPRTGQRVKKPYYNGIIFHRIIDGFMIQGGDPLGQGTGGPGYTFEDEFSPKLKHTKDGILSMANRGPNTNGGQFFITLAPTPWLDGKHTIFGEVVEGMDVIGKIGSVRTGPGDRPATPIVMTAVTIQRVQQ
jgi:peptidyl-prolyl cis-trans isomerase A (cyclophilin A)